jgi:hypothetical protein
VIVSLLLALGAVVTTATDFEAPLPSRILLVVALACFVASAVAAIITVYPSRYEGVHPDALDRLTQRAHWYQPREATSRRAAEAQVRILRTTRDANRSKAQTLAFALGAEATAVLFVGASIVVLLLRG